MARNYAALLHEYLEEMSDLSDTEFGRLARALLKYSATGEPIALSGNERFFAKRVMIQEDRLQASYDNSIDQKRKAGEASAAQRRSTAFNSVQRNQRIRTQIRTQTRIRTQTQTRFLRGITAQSRRASPRPQSSCR